MRHRLVAARAFAKLSGPICGDDGPGVLADAFGGDGCEHPEDGAVGVAELEWVDLARQHLNLLV